MGYRVGVDAAKERFGADAVFPIEELDEKLPEYVKDADRIFYRLGRDRPFNDKVLQTWQNLMRTYPKRGTGPIAIEDPAPTLHAMRQVKSALELEHMRRAAAIAADAHQRALSFARPGKFEYQVQAELEHTFRLNGALGPAYPSIVASGANSCILHYTENTKEIADGDLLLIDAGCAYGYYNSDITRTFPANGRFSEEQRIAQITPGNPYNQIHDTAVSVIVDGLMDLGLLQGDKEEIIKEEKYKPFYMHRTGHWLGLDVHDVGVYQHGDTPHNLEPGQVTTVEPGIYIKPDIKPVEGQPEVPERWLGIGIRIEDDVLVTPEGYDVLTDAVPKEIADIEAATKS